MSSPRRVQRAPVVEHNAVHYKSRLRDIYSSVYKDLASSSLQPSPTVVALPVLEDVRVQFTETLSHENDIMTYNIPDDHDGCLSYLLTMTHGGDRVLYVFDGIPIDAIEGTVSTDQNMVTWTNTTLSSV